MEKTYEELNEELIEAQNKITKKNIELNGLRNKVSQLKFKMEELRKENYDDLVGRYFILKTSDEYKTIRFYVKSFKESYSGGYVELFGIIFGISHDDGKISGYWFLEGSSTIFSKTELEEITKEEFESLHEDCYNKVKEYFNLK